MHLTLFPIHGLPEQAETTLAVSGHVLAYNGTAVDLGALVPEGGQFIPDEGDHPFIGAISRIDGEIHATVGVVLGADAAPHQPVDPAHWTVIATDGPVAIPAVRIAQEEPSA